METIKKSFERTKKRLFFGCAVLFLSAGTVAYPQAFVGVSGGLGVGNVTHKFTMNDKPANLSFSAPGANLALELLVGQVYMDMSFAMLFAPFKETIGNNAIDKSGYSANYALDFTALSIGYLHPLSEKLSVGGGLGFHVSGLTLTPKDNTGDKIHIGGNYGLIGLGLNPRARYSLSESVRLTLSIPLAIDLGAMSEDVVVGGIHYGKSPGIVNYGSLTPKYKGFSAGVYLSIGYFFEL